VTPSTGGRRVGDVDGGGAGEEAAEDGARRLLQPPRHGAPLLLPPRLLLPAAGAGGGTVARAADRPGVRTPGAVRVEREHGGALPDAAEAGHGALGHGLLLLGEGVAAEVHLPARVAVHHPRAAVPLPRRRWKKQLAAAPHARAAVVVGRDGGGALISPVAARHGHRLDELGVGLGPLVEADVAGTHRHASVHAPDRRLAPGRH
jgi:hypothetical protein